MRSWWHHEQLSIAAAVAAALHHSAQRGSHARPETHFAPRGQTTATEEEVRKVNDALEGQKRPPPGMRPAPLPEVAGPQAAVTGGYVAAGATLLGALLLADSSAEVIDGSTLSFLVEVKRKEEAVEAAELVELEGRLLVVLQRDGDEGTGVTCQTPASNSSPFSGSWPRTRRGGKRGRRRGN